MLGRSLRNISKVKSRERQEMRTSLDNILTKSAHASLIQKLLASININDSLGSRRYLKSVLKRQHKAGEFVGLATRIVSVNMIMYKRKEG